MYLRSFLCFFFFFNDTATTEIYTLSLHDALPISRATASTATSATTTSSAAAATTRCAAPQAPTTCSAAKATTRSEEHTSELQSRQYLVCRLLLEKKKKHKK